MQEQVKPAGILIKILNGKKIFSNQIRSNNLKVQMLVGGKSRQTKPAILDSADQPEWNQSFFYNSDQLVDDDILFSVTIAGSRLGQNQFGSKSISFYKLKNAAEKGYKNYEIRLQNSNGVSAGSIFVDVQYFENQQIVGSVGIPNFDMRPLNKQESQVHVPPPIQSSSIIKVKAPKRNFYSCMDDETTVDWQFMPRKFKQKNER